MNIDKELDLAREEASKATIIIVTPTASAIWSAAYSAAYAAEMSAAYTAEMSAVWAWAASSADNKLKEQLKQVEMIKRIL